MDKRNGAILLLSAAAVLLVVALMTKGWYRGEQQTLGIKAKVGVNIWGSTEACPGSGRCLSGRLELAKNKGGAKAGLIFGKTSMIVGVMSALLLLVVSGLLANRNPEANTAAVAALIGVGITTVCALLFLILKPDGAPGIGYSVLLFFPAVGVAIWANLMAMRALDYLKEEQA